jgi:hypothetical protein
MSQHPHAEIHRRARERIQAMSPDELVELLKRAGILGADGHVAERYRGRGADADRDPQPGADSP